MMKNWWINPILVKLVLAVALAGLLSACAGAPSSPPARQGDAHLVQGGSLAGEAVVHFPIRLPDDKK